MDSMVNKYTANRRLRSEDAYSPDGRHDLRPEYPTIVYTQILKRIFPDVPVVIGGIEASLRRLTHYDYWQGRLRPSILCDSGADLLVYGMGELPITTLCRMLEEKLLHGRTDIYVNTDSFNTLLRKFPIRQTVSLETETDIHGGICPDDIVLHPHTEAVTDPKKHAANFRHIEEESNRLTPQRILQQMPDGRYAVANPPYPPMTTAQVDRSFDLPYTRLPHPKYRNKRIPAFEMIRFSVNLHRGCFGGCAFCTISAHQGKFIMSRSKASILREVEAITRMPDFRGYLSDLGGPSANMYQMSGRDMERCQRCRRPSCIHPAVCPNLNVDHRPLLDVYHAVDALSGIKKSFVGSGVRYDLVLHDTNNEALNSAARQYARELIERHVSGRLKVAPEHTSDRVLRLMRKPPFALFHDFKRLFDATCRHANLNQQLIPYFISSHPGCTEEDMAELAAETRDMGFQLEQVQDFTPTPMTVSTTIWATGYHPYTLEPVFTARTADEKLRQRMFFFWYKPEERARITAELRRMGRADLINRLYGAAAIQPRHPTARKPYPSGKKKHPQKPSSIPPGRDMSKRKRRS